MADISSIKLPDNNTYTLKDTTARNLAAAAGTVKSVQVQATSPVQSSTSTAQTATLNTTISLADGYGDTKNPYASKTKNYVLAAPSTANGSPSFRALVEGDLPNITTDKLVRPNQIKSPINDVTLDGKINALRANRLAFLPADQIIIEKTTDGGTTWVDAGISDTVKVGLFSETRPSIAIPLLNGVKNINCGLRITFTAMKYNVPSGTAETSKYNYWNSNYVASTERYNQIKEMYFWVSTKSDTISVKLERATGAASTTWYTPYNNTTWGMTGWSGNDYIRFSQGVFGGGTNQTTNYWNYRLTFFTRGPGGSTTLSGTNTTSAQAIHEIRGYGDTYWVAGNNYASTDHLYTHDVNKNAAFPAQVTAIQFNGALNGTATKATQDASGNTITTTYATKSELPTASTTNPLMDGTASYGSGTVYARSNHVHPTDTSRQATLVSGTNIKTVNSTSLLGSGNIAVQPTLVSGTNIKTINSTSLLGSGNIEINSPNASDEIPLMDAISSAGTSNDYSRADHVHPVDTSRAASSHSHGYIASAGTMARNVAIASGDRFIIRDSSDSNKITSSSITFGTDTASFLANTGAWKTPIMYKLIEGKNIVFFGDSWTYGTGATTRLTDRFSTICANTLRMNEINYGVGAAGYTRPTKYKFIQEIDYAKYGNRSETITINGRTYTMDSNMSSMYSDGQTVLTTDQINDTMIVVINGGVNDIRWISETNLTAFVNAVIDTVTYASTLFPNALIVVGFTNTTRSGRTTGSGAQPSDTSITGFTDTQKHWAARALDKLMAANIERVIVSDMRYVTYCRDDAYVSDNLHPNNYGHQLVANQLINTILGSNRDYNYYLMSGITWDTSIVNTPSPGGHLFTYNGLIHFTSCQLTFTSAISSNTLIATVIDTVKPLVNVYYPIYSADKLAGQMAITPAGSFRIIPNTGQSLTSCFIPDFTYQV